VLAVFTELADFVARRHKLIIIAWIVALLVALPFVPMVNGVVQYEETSMAPSTLESEVAQRYIDEKFGNASDQPTTLIVISSSNVLDDDVKQAVYNIEHGVNKASLNGNIHKVEVNSVYSLMDIYVLNVLRSLNGAYGTANSTVYMIYGMPQDYYRLWDDVNQSAHGIYDLPAMYSHAWAEQRLANPAWTVDQVDRATYLSVEAQVQSTSSTMSADQCAFLRSWLVFFAEGWNGTQSLASDPLARGHSVHSQEFDSFLSALPVTDEEKALLVHVNRSFSNLAIDPLNLTTFSTEVFEQRLNDTLSALPSSEKQLVHGYLGNITAWWASLAAEPSMSALEQNTSAIAHSFGQSISDPATKDSFFELQQAFDFDSYNDPVIRDATISELIASSPQLAQVSPQPWVVSAAASIGPGQSLTRMMELGQHIVSNSSLTAFPIKVPTDLVSRLVSTNNATMLIALTYQPIAGTSDPGQDDVDAIRQIVSGAISGTSIRTYVTGSDPLSTDLEISTNKDLQIVEPVTIILVLVLIGLFFRSFVASSIPPMVIGLALGITYALVYFLGTYVLAVHYSVLTLLLTSMLGAGCDYCIFILSRYREERRNGRDKEQSVRQAVTWAGESIATSGATVIIGFGVLAVGRFGMMQSMGVSLALGVTVALLVALTLLPSILILLGDRTFWPARVTRPVKKRVGSSYFNRSARFAIKHAKVLVIASILISIPCTYLVATLESSYDFMGAMPETESKQGLHALQEGFGAGRVLPTQIALNMTSPLVVGSTFDTTELGAIENASLKIAGLDNVKQIVGPTRPNGSPMNYSDPAELSQNRAAMMQMVSSDGRSVLMTVTFVAEPFNKNSIDAIQQLRDIAVDIRADSSIESVYIAGSTASMYDIANMVQSDFSTMEVLVVIGIYVVLLVVLGSVINPLRSILTILLSISWTLATTMVLFQYVLGQQILYLVPMILLIVCLGLGMDYDILLTTRVREEAAKGKDNNEAIVAAVEQTGGIITACGIIMAASFGSMMLSNGFLLKEFGFALMFAILLDAMIVRIFLVPAIMSLLGKWNWWAPGPMRRMNERRTAKRVETLRAAETSLTVPKEREEA
jgi:putative drug exporter of the RND superfamily